MAVTTTSLFHRVAERCQGSLRRVIRATGFDIVRYRPGADPPHRNRWLQLIRHLQEQRVDLVWDVGANVGQFGSDLIAYGYQGRIVSIEPLTSAHAQLAQTSAAHPNWTVAERCAVGDRNGELTLNIAANWQSSSLLPMTEAHRKAAPHATFVGAETTPVRLLDQLRDRYAAGVERMAIKLDVQGYEAHVLAGATQVLAQTKLLLAEMSLVPMYEGETIFEELYRGIKAMGFECCAIHSAYTSPESYRVLQVDAIFVQREGRRGSRLVRPTGDRLTAAEW
jgi:FkbM family methyltransferase